MTSPFDTNTMLPDVSGILRTLGFYRHVGMAVTMCVVRFGAGRWRFSSRHRGASDSRDTGWRKESNRALGLVIGDTGPKLRWAAAASSRATMAVPVPHNAVVMVRFRGQ